MAQFQQGGTDLTNMSSIEKIATNKYFIGFVMITMNIGARFLIEELTPPQKRWINTQTFRRLIVFNKELLIIFCQFLKRSNNIVFTQLN